MDLEINLNNPEIVCEGLWSSKKNFELCDAEVIVNGDRIPVHANVLAATSGYFRNMFFNCSLSEVVFENVDKEAIELLIEYCYTGVLKITQENVEELMSMAHILSIPTITSKSVEVEAKNFNLSNCNTSWKMTILGRLEKTTSNICESNKDNIVEFSDSKRFLNLNCLDILEFLKTTTFSDELEKYNTVKKWVYHDIESRKECIYQLVTSFKLEYVPKEILEKELPICDSNPECYEYFIKAIKSNRSSQPKPIHSLLAVGSDNLSTSSTFELYNATENEWVEIFSHDVKIDRTDFTSVLLNEKELLLIGGYDITAVDTVEMLDLETLKLYSAPNMKYFKSRASAVKYDNYVYVIGGFDNRPIPYVEKWNSHLNRWIIVAPLLVPRNGCGVKILDNEIYVIGGFGGVNNDEFLNSVEVYNSVTDKWTMRAPMNEKREAPGVAIVGYNLYAVGGWNEFGVASLTAEKYNPKINKWTLITSTYIERFQSSAADLNGQLVVAGGYSNGSTIASVDVYDEKTKKWKAIAPMQNPRRGFNLIEIPLNLAEKILTHVRSNKTLLAIGSTSNEVSRKIEIFHVFKREWVSIVDIKINRNSFNAVLLDEQLILIGGMEDEMPVSTVESYDLKTGNIEKLASMYQKRYLNTVVLLNGKIFAIGGVVNGTDLSSVEVYNPSDDSWNEIDPMITPRSACGAAVLGGDIYVVGGFSHHEGCLLSMEVYKYKTNRWESRRSMTVRRQGPGVVATGNYLYVAGGRFTNFSETATVERYDPTIDRWTMIIPPLKEPKSYLAATSIDGVLVFAGGETANFNRIRNTIEAYYPDSETWKILPPFNEPRSYFSIIAIDWVLAKKVFS